jgi:hypothetical protein
MSGDGGGDDCGGDAPAGVRVRGIYATALTRLLLDAGRDVAAASPPIRERFDADLGGADYAVAVETTDDRQGVGVVGAPAPANAVADALLTVGRDALCWTDPTPPGAVYDGRVTETLGGGAVVDLGDGEGYLPFDAADGYVEAGDAVRVQVASSSPPWADDRPSLSTTLRSTAGPARLVAGREGTTVAGGDGAAARELAGMTDLLDADRPEGWGVEWRRGATDADLSALDGALTRAAARAADLETATEAPVDAPATVAVPRAARWLWFGRESRFALDERRRAVATTMPGHHRVKAATGAASAAVDLVEAVCAPDDGPFQFGAVARAFGPAEGDTVAIGHGKPDGRLIVLGRGEVTDLDPDGSLSVERSMTAGGTYDALGVEREAGDTALTTFTEGRWWYPTVYRDDDGRRKGTYVNVCTPVECFPDAVRYVDLHVDVVKLPDGEVRRVDDDELDAAVDAGHVSEPLAERARSVASAIERGL